MTDSQITLIAKEYQKNKYGVLIPEKVKTTIFAEMKSVTQKEFFAAGKNGIKAAYSVTILCAEYGNQETVEIGGKSYKVYRTYQSSDDKIELYLEEALGET